MMMISQAISQRAARPETRRTLREPSGAELFSGAVPKAVPAVVSPAAPDFTLFLPVNFSAPLYFGTPVSVGSGNREIEQQELT